MNLSLMTELKSSIEGYILARNTRTRQSLSRRSGVSHNTISRILKLQQNPTYETAYNILQVTEPSGFIGILKNHFPDIGHYNDLDESSTKKTYQGNELSRAFTDNTSFSIFCLAARKSGITRAAIKENFGLQGQHIVDKLISHGILLEEHDRIICSRDVILDISLLTRALDRSLKMFSEIPKHDKFGLDWYAEGVNDEGYQALWELQKNYIERAKQIVSSSPGKRTAIYGGMIYELKESPYTNED